MKALVTGGTGFIGQALASALLEDGWQLVILTRQVRSDTATIRYIQSLHEIAGDEVFAAVINLAGASLAGKRWSEAYKDEIFSSRVALTHELVDMMARLDHCPPALLSASAVGFYGHHGDESLTEQSPSNVGFSSRLCQEWEAAALRAEALGCRVCLLRLGVVLDRSGGALEDMSRSFRMGVATWMGNGLQFLSWVHRADVVAAVQFLLDDEMAKGPFNITAPEPVTSVDFARALKQKHKTLLSVGLPATLMKLALGEMADELLLHGQRVLPARLQDSGFTFKLPDIMSALNAVYGDS